MNRKFTEPVKAIIYLILGLMILFLFNETLVGLFLLLSLYLIIDGFIHIFQGFIEEGGIRDILSGVLSVIIGFFFIINSELSLALTIYILAAKFLFEGISYLYNSYKNRKFQEKQTEWLMIGKNILIVIISIWLIAQPISNITLFFKVFGIYLLITGVIKVIQTFDELREEIGNIELGRTLQDSKSYLVSGAVYALGFGVGTILIALFLTLDQDYLNRLESSRTIAGIVLIIILAFVHALFAGGLGAFLVTRFNEKVLQPRKFILWSILGLTVANTILIIPTVFAIFGISFLGDSSFTLAQSIVLFAIFGTLYGLISSTVHVYKHLSRGETIQTISYMATGYAVGGGLMGIFLYQWFFHQEHNVYTSTGAIWLIIGVLLFGFMGGVALNRSLTFLRASKESEKVEVSKTGLSNFFTYLATSEWLSKHTAKRFIALLILVVVGVGLLTAFILNRPELADNLNLQTVGTHWNEPTDAKLVGSALIKGIRENEQSKHNYLVTCEDGEVTVSGVIGSELSPGYYSTPSCLAGYDPQVALDSDERVHLFWVSDEVTDVNEVTRDQKVIYESIYLGDQFSEPALIVVGDDIQDFAVRSNNDNTLQILWLDGENSYSSTLPDYDCTDAEMTASFERALEESKTFHKNEILPSCGNRFDRILYTPNPSKEYSDLEPREDGVYDYVSDLIAEAEHEVLFTNMWYDQAVQRDSPGTYVSDGVSRLYENVKENPDNYPRGVTVRILLGNPPEFVLLDTRTQIWSVLEDLRAEGVEKMVDEEIGWRVEVANFNGALPHSHTKSMIVDGKTVVGAGFNVTYKHLPSDHPSKKGADNVDTALQITGPIAQLSMAAFDNLWEGAKQKHCEDFFPTPEDSWALTCYDKTATVSHVPEVLRFYIPEDGGDSNALSLYRTYNYKEADEVLEKSLRSAEKSIDTIQVNFSLKLICDLNVLVKVCDFNDNVAFLDAIMESIEENGTEFRILTKKDPIESIENNIAIEEFMIELEKRGLKDQVEIRYFDGNFHNKAVQIDRELLYIGSQNFHYSAWGDGGLTEFNLATDNELANEEFNRFFEYEWERGLPIEESK